MGDICFRVVDLETVGFLDEQPDAVKADPCQGIVEIGWTDVIVSVRPDNSIGGVMVDDRWGTVLFKPPGGIPKESMGIHHITDKMVADCGPCTASLAAATFSAPTQNGAPFALVAHNKDFEAEWLAKYLPADARWICTLKVAARLFPDWKSHANQACRYLLGLELDDKWASPPHRAGPDSWVTAHVFAAFLKQTSVRQMLEWTRLPKLMLTCPIGKDWRGKTWGELDDSSLRWISDKGADMDPDVLYWARAELQKRELMRRQPELSGDYE